MLRKRRLDLSSIRRVTSLSHESPRTTEVGTDAVNNMLDSHLNQTCREEDTQVHPHKGTHIRGR